MKNNRNSIELFRDNKTVLLLCIAIVYFFIVLDITLIDRTVGQRRHMLEPFWELSQLFQSGRYLYWLFQICGNVLMLMPMGMFFPMIFRRFDNLRTTTAVCLVFSLFIELTQYFTGRGLCEFDDIMHNTFGGVIGFIIYRKIADISAEYRRMNYH